MSSCSTPSCAGPDPQASCCPTSFCHDGLLNLPERSRVEVVGTERGSRCLGTFARTRRGVLLYDGLGGAILTEQPTLQIPFLHNLILGQDGRPIIGGDGHYQEDDPPGAPNLIISDDCGKQWRWHGRRGTRQAIIWNGCSFVMIPDPSQAELADFPSVTDGSDCGYYEAVLVDKGGGTYGLGYKTTRTNTPGVVQMFAGPKTTIPADALFCDGQSYSASTYPELFAAIGYTWGKVGDDFRVPDMRGQFARGADDGSGVDPDANSRTAKYAGGNSGNQIGSYQEDAFQCHTFQRTDYAGKVIEQGTGVDVAIQDLDNQETSDVGGAIAEDCGEPRTADETRPKNAAIHFIIFSGCKVV